jgi:hypothetical protein
VSNIAASLIGHLGDSHFHPLNPISYHNYNHLLSRFKPFPEKKLKISLTHCQRPGYGGRFFAGKPWDEVIRIPEIRPSDCLAIIRAFRIYSFPTSATKKVLS